MNNVYNIVGELVDHLTKSMSIRKYSVLSKAVYVSTKHRFVSRVVIEFEKAYKGRDYTTFNELEIKLLNTQINHLIGDSSIKLDQLGVRDYIDPSNHKHQKLHIELVTK